MWCPWCFNEHWNIPLISLSDHVYDKITFKKLGLVGVLTKEKDRVMVVWLNGITRSWIINLLIITKVESGRINSN